MAAKSLFFCGQKWRVTIDCETILLACLSFNFQSAFIPGVAKIRSSEFSVTFFVCFFFE